MGIAAGAPSHHGLLDAGDQLGELAAEDDAQRQRHRDVHPLGLLGDETVHMCPVALDAAFGERLPLKSVLNMPRRAISSRSFHS
jgi:hypothetical protein